MGIFSLLGAETNPNESDNQGAIYDAFLEAHNIAKLIGTISVALCLTCVTAYALYIGAKFATAKDEGARKELKMQFIYTLVALVGYGAFFAIFEAGMNGLKVTFNFKATAGNTVDLRIQADFAKITLIVVALLNIAKTLLMPYTLWLCWKLASAKDESARKNAKMQVFYAVIGAILVATIPPVVAAATGIK
jgi:hypothetical protein